MYKYINQFSDAKESLTHNPVQIIIIVLIQCTATRFVSSFYSMEFHFFPFMSSLQTFCYMHIASKIHRTLLYQNQTMMKIEI